MSGRAHVAPRTARHRAWPRSPGAGVVPPVSEPGFLALSDAMRRRTFLELEALPTAPSRARLHTRQLLRDWGLDKLADTTEEVVSELVTNALETTIRHSLDAPVRLRLSSNGQGVLIEIWDADPAPPRIPALDASRLPQTDAEGGRGLFLVASLSERWNCYTTSACGGKVVWAEVSS